MLKLAVERVPVADTVTASVEAVMGAPGKDLVGPAGAGLPARRRDFRPKRGSSRPTTLNTSIRRRDGLLPGGRSPCPPHHRATVCSVTSTFKQMPMIFSARQVGGVIGQTATVAAFGPLLFSVSLGAVIALTGNAKTFFYGPAAFALAHVALNWLYYQRKGCEKPC